MVLPFQLTLIPLYVLMVKLGWVDTYAALILPYTMSPFAILLFRQFFLNIPQDLVDAARIDGLSDFRNPVPYFLAAFQTGIDYGGHYSFYGNLE